MNTSGITSKHPCEAEAGAAANQFVENIFIGVDDYIC